MTWKELTDKLLNQGGVLLSDTIGGIIGHFFISKIEGEGDQKKVTKKLDLDAIRAHAPFFVLKYADEAAYNGLKIELDPGLRVNLEEKMGPVLPLPPGVAGPLPAPFIGKHQRADIILTIDNMLVPENMGGITKAACRRAALERLRQLAEIDDPQEWVRAAVADKLMKERESDYLGAQLTDQAQRAFHTIVQEFPQAKTDYDAWAAQEARRMRNYRRRVATRQRQRTRNPFIRLATSFVRMFEF